MQQVVEVNIDIVLTMHNYLCKYIDFFFLLMKYFYNGYTRPVI